MVLSARSATQATICHLEITIIVKKDTSGTGHMEFIPEGVTVYQHRYKEILGRKRPELWCRKNWLLLYDTAPAHCSVLVQVELAK
jgi:hypothetical protein